MYAFKLKQVDKQFDMHLQAWLQNQVTATKEQGNKHVPVYKKFSDFYDYEKEIKKVLHNESTTLTPREKTLVKIAKMHNEGR